MKKKAILFDLYGTLIDIHTDETKEMLWEKLTLFYGYQGAEYEQLQDAYLHHVEKLKARSFYNYPDIDILEVFKALYEEEGANSDLRLLKDTATLFRVLSVEHIRLYPHVVSLLTSLQKRYRLVLMSNAQAAFTQAEIDLMGIRSYFDGIHLSSDYGVSKPDPGYFQAVLKNEGLLPEECIYIGNDHIADVKGASQVGMESIYIHTNCSHQIVPEFECLLKVMDGDHQKIIDFFL